jgi:hypothetical protein
VPTLSDVPFLTKDAFAVSCTKVLVESLIATAFGAVSIAACVETFTVVDETVFFSIDVESVAAQRDWPIIASNKTRGEKTKRFFMKDSITRISSVKSSLLPDIIHLRYKPKIYGCTIRLCYKENRSGIGDCATHDLLCANDLQT